MGDSLSFLQYLISLLFNFTLPAVGITFGALVVGLFGLPLLVKAFKKLF